MIKCQVSGRQLEPGEKPVRVVIQTRPKKYTNTFKKRIIESTGWEIVKEIWVAPEVANKMKNGEKNEK